MFVCTLGEEGGGGLKKCTVCTLMKMLTFLDGPLIVCPLYGLFKILSGKMGERGKRRSSLI